jgi:hypothetical protein
MLSPISLFCTYLWVHLASFVFDNVFQSLALHLPSYFHFLWCLLYSLAPSRDAAAEEILVRRYRYIIPVLRLQECKMMRLRLWPSFLRSYSAKFTNAHIFWCGTHSSQRNDPAPQHCQLFPLSSLLWPNWVLFSVRLSLDSCSLCACCMSCTYS